MTAPPPLEYPVPPRAIVMASAGTGKTYALSTRLLQTLLERGPDADPAGILATTFTRKAAGEILRRVLRPLLDAAREPARLIELSQNTGLPLTPDACTAAAAALARRMDRVRIMTIDALLARMAKAAVLELEVPPDWRIAEDVDLDERRRTAIDDALAGVPPHEIQPILRAVATRPYTRLIHAGIGRLVRAAYDAHLLAGADPSAWDAIAPDGQPLGQGDLTAALDALLAAELPTTSARAPDANYTKAVASLDAAMRRQDWETVLTAGLGKASLTTGEYYRKPIPSGLAAAIDPLVRHARWHVLASRRERNLAAAHLLARYDDASRRLCRDRGLLGFEDIPRLLVEGEVAGRLSDLWYRLDAGLDALLIDEAQDTSLIQFRLLDPLLDELLSGGDHPRPVLVVGDVKQSLYAWRSAEAMLLPEIAQRWPALERRSLTSSYRSSRVVLDAVNDTFATIADSPAVRARPAVQRAAADFQALFIPQHTAAGRPAPPGLLRVRSHPIDSSDDRAKPRSDLVAGAVRATLALLDEARHHAPSIAILLRTNKHIRPLVAALREALRDTGIDASPEGGTPLADDPVVAVMLSVLHLADHPTDLLAAYHVATSPLAPAIGWTRAPTPARARRWAARVRRRLCTRGYAWVLERLLARIHPAIPHASRERTDQLLDLARDFDLRASLRPSEFLAIVAQRRVARSSPAQVRVMTIHAAKGLEFDAVILPELDRRWGSDGHGALVHRPGVVGPATALSLSVPRDLGLAHPLLQEMLDQRDRREAFEQLCTLYVAMTRARRALVMLVDPFEAPKRSSDPPSPRASMVVRAALAPSIDHAEPDAPIIERATPEPWFTGLPTRASPPSEPAQPRATTQHAPPAPLDAAGAPPAIRLAPPPPRSLRRAPVVSPSSLEGGGVIDLAARLTAAPGGAADVGTIAHAMLASITWLERQAWTSHDLLAAAGAVRAARPDAIDRAAAIVSAFLASPAASVLSRASHRPPHDCPGARPEAEPRREWKFLLAEHADDRSRLLSGVVDRLVILRDKAGRAVAADVIDFKTDRPDPADPGGLAARVEHYRPQLDAYRRAVASLFALPPTSVRASLAFVSLARVESL